MIRKRVKVFSSGLMVESMKATGKKVSRMASVYITVSKTRLDTVFGKLEKGRSGSHKTSTLKCLKKLNKAEYDQFILII